MERIPITFEHKGKQYSGLLMPVTGIGETHGSLLIDNYYIGNLRYTDRWIFDSNTMPEIADFLGRLYYSLVSIGFKLSY